MPGSRGSVPAQGGPKLPQEAVPAGQWGQSGTRAQDSWRAAPPSGRGFSRAVSKGSLVGPTRALVAYRARRALDPGHPSPPAGPPSGRSPRPTAIGCALLVVWTQSTTNIGTATGCRLH